MAVNNWVYLPKIKFAIGQRVRVVKVGRWNGTWPDRHIHWLVGIDGTVRENNRDTIGVEPDWGQLGTLQFLPDELAVLDNTSGDSVE